MHPRNQSGHRMELMREAAERNYHIDACSSWGAHEAYDVAFRVHEPRRPLIEFDPSAPIVHHTIRFPTTRCECDEHGQFTALLFRGEKPFCPFCIASWEADMRRVLAKHPTATPTLERAADIIDPDGHVERAIA